MSGLKKRRAPLLNKVVLLCLISLLTGSAAMGQPIPPPSNPISLIQSKYNQLGRAKGFLGMPTTEERATPDGVGKFRHFEGGSIYWHPQTGVRVERGK